MLKKALYSSLVMAQFLLVNITFSKTSLALPMGTQALSTHQFESERLVDDEDREVKIRVSLVSAGQRNIDYTIDSNVDLDYQMLVEKIRVNSGELITASDKIFFLKKAANHNGSIQFYMYHCLIIYDCKEEWKSSISISNNKLELFTSKYSYDILRELEIPTDYASQLVLLKLEK